MTVWSLWPNLNTQGSPNLTAEHSKFYFNGKELKKKKKKSSEVIENTPKILAEIKTVAKFFAFVLPPSVILMLY